MKKVETGFTTKILPRLDLPLDNVYAEILQLLLLLLQTCHRLNLEQISLAMTDSLQEIAKGHYHALIKLQRSTPRSTGSERDIKTLPPKLLYALISSYMFHIAVWNEINDPDGVEETPKSIDDNYWNIISNVEVVQNYWNACLAKLLLPPTELPETRKLSQLWTQLHEVFREAYQSDFAQEGGWYKNTGRENF